MSHVAADARLEPAADDWTETPDVESGSKSEDDHTSDPAAGALPQLLDRAPRLVKRPVAYAVSQTDSMLKTLGRYVDLVVQSFAFLISDIVRLRHPWQDTVIQSWFILTVTVVPAILVSIPFGVIVAVQAGSIISQVGASSISGAAGGLGVIQQGAPIVAALLLGGAAGSAVATDLGARSIREEVDAMRVMGVNPVQRLVTPRLAAILFVSPLLCIFIIFVGIFAGYLVNVGFQGGTPGSYLSSYPRSLPSPMSVMSPSLSSRPGFSVWWSSWWPASVDWRPRAARGASPMRSTPQW